MWNFVWLILIIGSPRKIETKEMTMKTLLYIFFKFLYLNT